MGSALIKEQNNISLVGYILATKLKKNDMMGSLEQKQGEYGEITESIAPSKCYEEEESKSTAQSNSEIIHVEDDFKVTNNSNEWVSVTRHEDKIDIDDVEIYFDDSK